MDLLIYMLGPGLLVTRNYTLFFIKKYKKYLSNLAALVRLEHFGYYFASIYTLHSISQIWKGTQTMAFSKKTEYFLRLWMFRLIFTLSLLGRVCRESAWGRSSRRWASSEWGMTSDPSDQFCQGSPSWRRAPPWAAPGMTTSTLAAPVTCPATSTGEAWQMSGKKSQFLSSTPSLNTATPSSWIRTGLRTTANSRRFLPIYSEPPQGKWRQDSDKNL